MSVPADRGEPDPALAAALAAYDESPAATARVHAALLAARLLVPVVPHLLERDERGADKATEMAVPVIIGKDGRRGLPAFTCLTAMAAWRADARPAPMPAGQTLAGAAEEGYDAVVLDPAGPVLFVVEDDDLAALARGHVPVPGAPGVAVRTAGAD